MRPLEQFQLDSSNYLVSPKGPKVPVPVGANRGIDFSGSDSENPGLMNVPEEFLLLRVARRSGHSFGSISLSAASMSDIGTLPQWNPEPSSMNFLGTGRVWPLTSSRYHFYNLLRPASSRPIPIGPLAPHLSELQNESDRAMNCILDAVPRRSLGGAKTKSSVQKTKNKRRISRALGEITCYLNTDPYHGFTHYALCCPRKHKLALRTPPYAGTKGVVLELLTCGDGETDGQLYARCSRKKVWTCDGQVGPKG